MTALTLLATDGFEDYRLIDSGGGRKLERYGAILIDRPEPQAMWRPSHPNRWASAHARFQAAGEGEDGGRWQQMKPVPEAWPLRYRGLTVFARLTPFRHIGLFPDQVGHWDWMADALSTAGIPQPRVLNLFAYTGVASLVAAAAGAEVTHVDASRKAIDWAKENQSASGLDPTSIRWILDDCLKFVEREVRRGRRYHGILLDPPKYGRGAKGEVWDLFEHLPALLAGCAALLADDALFLICTAYAMRASAIAIDQTVREALADRAGSWTTGELAVREQGGQRCVPTSLFVRWARDA
ncbi:MAG: class I SAM-dependent rRNA methyltransferase [Alphaproteobacteria bacterium]|nr:MAG: class I SAM-dependent rRNA methyltransferase [Alphaproteobacteria bacterium]